MTIPLLRVAKDIIICCTQGPKQEKGENFDLEIATNPLEGILFLKKIFIVDDMLEHEDEGGDGEKDGGSDDTNLNFGSNSIGCFEKTFIACKL